MGNPAKSVSLLFRRADPDDGPAVRDLVFSILRERGLATDAHTDADLEDLYGHYFATGGDFRVLTTEAGEIVGSIGLKPVDKRTIELRKMYLRPEHRGHHHGRRMLDWAVTRSRELGYKRITLETAAVLKEAISLYTSHGFKPYEACERSPRCDQSYELEL
jgi:GNAT superfamily N-acetyltransferase